MRIETAFLRTVTGTPTDFRDTPLVTIGIVSSREFPAARTSASLTVSEARQVATALLDFVMRHDQ